MDNPYTDILINHYKSKKNRGTLSNPTHKEKGRNATCGDEITLEFILTGNGILKDIRFHGEGCMISQASASLLCDAVKGKSESEIIEIYHEIRDLVRPPYEQFSEEDIREREYLALADIQKYPARTKCALLSWKTLIKGMSEHRDQ